MTIVHFPEIVGRDGIFVDGDWVESKDQDPNGDVRLLQLADIGDGEYRNRSERFLTSEKAAQLRCTYLKPGDIMLARMPDPIGRACIFPGDEKPCVTVVDVCIIRPDPNQVYNRWLLHHINSPQFRFLISRFTTGTTRKRISRGNLAKLPFTLPPLEEQRRIAAILDKADALRRQRRAALAKLDTLLQATFLHMFGDPVTNPMGWPVQPLTAVANLKGGFAFKSRDYESEGIPLIRIGEVNRRDFDSQNSIFIPTDFKTKLSRFIVRNGTILMSLTGTTGKDDYGNAVVLDGVRDEYFLNQRVAAIATKTSSMTDTYLCQFLQAPMVKRQLTGKSRGIRQANISNADILRLRVPSPPVFLQEKFEAITQNLKQQEAKFIDSISVLDTLFHSLQQRAFRGDL